MGNIRIIFAAIQNNGSILPIKLTKWILMKTIFHEWRPMSRIGRLSAVMLMMMKMKTQKMEKEIKVAGS